MADRSRPTVLLPYRETVQGSLVLVAVVLLAAVGAAAGVVAVALDTTLSPGERIVTGALMLAVVLVLLFVATVFRRLQIEVNAARLRWSFGPFGKSVLLEEVAVARVEPYRWLKFGGWGIRFGLFGGGGRAYTVPFSLRGVAIELHDRQRYYLSSNDPDRLAAAIEAAQGSGGASR